LTLSSVPATTNSTLVSTERIRSPVRIRAAIDRPMTVASERT